MSEVLAHLIRIGHWLQ